MSTLYVILAILAVVVFWFIIAYNRFVRLNRRKDEAWSDIDVQLKRRHDLIPNLVETIKGYASHERELFEKVTQARAQAISASGAAQKGEAEKALSGALKSLFAVAENYPQLRASENFGKLQEELSDTENKIQAARRFYNGNARDLNIAVETFPSNLVAKVFGFKQAEFFEVEGEAEKNPVEVKF
ncbi:MAG: LemA family protein [Candidatus Portnoybacteria bacterium]|nr:LemA family protein [Candidatus Portnoybacteria bacterium]